MIKEIHAETVLKKRTFAHSQVSSSDWGKITNELNIEVVPVATLGVAAGEGAQVDPFDWALVLRADQEIVLAEEQQRKAYIEYVESNIGTVLTEKELCVYGIRDGASYGLEQELDVLWVADKKSNSVLIHRVFIDNPGDGFEVIKTLLRQSSADSDAEIEFPYFECPLKRLKLRSALPIVTEGGESGGIRESIERYYDISSMLGPDIDMARVWLCRSHDLFPR
ncbi:hypothetical protein PC116_g20490 [Phytophthora cactorum]|nr:hypothetical protein PC116_g20490 [Phytophthora cactorum]